MSTAGDSETSDYLGLIRAAHEEGKTQGIYEMGKAQVAYEAGNSRGAYEAGKLHGVYDAGKHDANAERDEQWNSIARPAVSGGPNHCELEEQRYGPGGREHFGDTREGDYKGGKVPWEPEWESEEKEAG